MAPSIEAIKNREVRGCIMRALAASPGRPMSSKSLQMALIEVSTDISQQLYYLGDKGYIRVVDAKDKDLSGIEYLINLTAKGIDLLEESIPADPGVAL